jgi:ribosomal protein L29
MAAKKTAAATKNKEVANLAGLDQEGLEKELASARKELYLLQMKKVAGELKETHQIRVQKKRVAQALTFLSAL